MPVFRDQIFQNVTSLLFVDKNTTVALDDQNGTIEKPYSGIQQAIDRAAGSGSPTWEIKVAFGDYTADSLTMPSNLRLVVEGPTKRGTDCATGPITWTVTGNNTSAVTFKRLNVGPLTVVDDVTPATLVRLIYLECDCRGVNVTGTSNVNLAYGSETNANFDPSLSSVTSAVVSGDINNGTGILLASNTQFQSTCTSITAGSMFAGGCSFAQDITISGATLQIITSTFSGSGHTVTSTQVGLSDALVDHPSSVSFVSNGWTQINFAIKVASFNSTGIIAGGIVTRATGLDLNVSQGAGFIFHQTESATRYVTWAGTVLTLPANSLVDIYVNDQKQVLSAPHPIDQRDSILLATAGTSASGVLTLSAEHVETMQVVPQLSEYAIKLFGALHVSGLITEVYSPPGLQLEVDSGTYYNGIHFNSTTAASPITFTYWYRNGSGGWTTSTGHTAIDPNFYDNGTGTLAALTTGQWKKDLLFVSTNDGGQEFHVVYAQEYYSSSDEAVSGHIPAVSDDILNTSLRLAGLVVQGASSQVTVVVDLKPKLGQFSTGTTAVTDHGLLSGLSDDDHLQYQLRTEKNQPNGYPGLNGSSKVSGSQQTYGTTSNTAVEGNDPRVPTQPENDALQGTDGAPSNTNRFVTNTDPRNTNARTPTAHASTHRPAGSDIIYSYVSVRTVSSTTTVLVTDDVVRCNGTFTLNLPVSVGNGKVYYIKNIGTGDITVVADGSDTIDGQASKIIKSRYSDMQLVDSASGFWDIL